MAASTYAFSVEGREEAKTRHHLNISTNMLDFPKNKDLYSPFKITTGCGCTNKEPGQWLFQALFISRIFPLEPFH